jgi:diadenosine tetraphosphate (Ap4A) HIT family hydrolase
MAEFQLHPQLAQDSHPLGATSAGLVLLMRTRALHWLVLVPPTDRLDLLDLPAAQQGAVLSACADLHGLLKHQLGYPRVNFAAIGNLVPQLHLHLVGRREGDVCWPKPVWGNLPLGERDWLADEVAALRGQLAGVLLS